MTTEQKEQLENYGFDIKATLKRFMNKEDLYEKFLLKFLEDKNFEKLKSEMDAKEYDAAILSAHTLKGVAGNLGINPIFDTVSIVHEKLRKREIEQIDEALFQLSKSFETVIHAITKIFR